MVIYQFQGKGVYPTIYKCWKSHLQQTPGRDSGQFSRALKLIFSEELAISLPIDRIHSPDSLIPQIYFSGTRTVLSLSCKSLPHFLLEDRSTSEF